jgi:alcohol dehydrogenase (cytochrome c)
MSARIRSAAASLLIVLTFVVAVWAQRGASRPVTSKDLLDGLKNTGRWLTYSGDYTSRRHSPLKQIAPGNVARLVARWTFTAEGMPPGRGFTASPIVVDGVIYMTGNANMAWAIDARTGKELWRYKRQLPTGLSYGGGNTGNRGFAVLGDSLFMGTLDAHLIAIDRHSGDILWDVVLDDYKLGHAALSAPVVVKDKVIMGNSGGDMASRGFLDAYDAKTGARLWRFYTIPAPGEPGSETWSSPDVLPRGGGAMWVSGSYDPELNLLYWGTGNPNPNYFGDNRLGDNLYTASIVALDADTGKLKWHYQFTPHDTHDWDANNIPILAELSIRGQRHKVVMVANRNGFFYTLDRATGKLLVAKPFTATEWAREIGPDGRPIVLNTGMTPTGQPNVPTTCVPELRGGTNYNPPSYDPNLALFFVMARESCAIYIPQDLPVQAGRLTNGGTMRTQPDPSFSALRAIDPKSGDLRWEFKFPTLNLAGVMSTASGLVFAGDNERNFNAFDSRTGKRLWSTPMRAPIYGAAATTYMLDGKQYILIPAGLKLVAFALP